MHGEYLLNLSICLWLRISGCCFWHLVTGFLLAQILALHLSQFVTLCGTYFGNYSHSFIFISQPSFVPNG